MKICAIIMAGGRGERFWPLSRKEKPKQFLSLTGDGKTMIQLTFNRFNPLVEPENIYVVTNEMYKDLVSEQLPEMPSENILCEPCGKNTAPCIALAAAVVSKKHDNSVMIVLPSDHMIQNEVLFIETLKKAILAAEKGENLVTIGIKPTYPETGYGYIKFKDSENSAFEVERFVEKPDLATAEKYLAGGGYLWNGGIFIWKTSTIISKIQKYLPEIYDGFLQIKEIVNTAKFNETLKKCFDDFDSVSLDYGIMEKAENIYTIPGDFGWNDVGGFAALGDINAKDENGNVASGNIITVNTKNSIILGNNKLIAAVGLEDIIIVDTGDALLVCHKDSAQDVKRVVEGLSGDNRKELL